MRPPTSRLAHIALNTADLDRFLHFYGEVVGLGDPVIESAAGAAYRRLATWETGPALRLLVFEVPGFDPSTPSGSGGSVGSVDHLGFAPIDPRSRGDTVDRLVAAGRSTGEQTMAGGWRSVRFTDPDGAVAALVWPAAMPDATTPRPI